MQNTLLLVALFTYAIVPAECEAAAPKSKKEKLDIDFSAELPRIPPTKPAEALKSFVLRPGFHIELVAAEPLLHDPVALDFDENGRMFVVELQPYNLYANENEKRKGLIRLLEDVDGDGCYEKQTVFTDTLIYPTAVACYDGGLFVGDAPDLLYLKDTDGDGRADLRKVVFTGFGTDKAGEAHLNSFRWGFDNRFHVSTGLDGGNVRATADKKSKPVSVRGRGFLFDPRSLTFELTSGGGQHGMSSDDWGRTFICSNSNPAQTLIFDGRYLARNPYLAAPSPAVNIAPEGKFTHLFRISPAEPWRVLRTRLRKEGLVGGSAEGGRPFGFFTGATGVTIYRGDAWPAEYRGNLIVGDVANNIIYRANVKSRGVGVVAERADPGADFVASKDNWFRPVQFANAPDGTLYVIDMYRELIEGAAFLPPDILKHMDVASGIDRGRIYRIAPDRFKRPAIPKLADATTAELVSLLEHTNGWHRDTASRLLYERQDLTAVALLKRLAARSSFPQGRMHALYALDGLNALDAQTLLGALDDVSPRVREHAVRLAEKRAAGSSAIRTKLVRMIDDDDVGVRYQLAFSLGALRGNGRNRALATLLVREGGDQWFRLAVQSSLDHGAGQVFRLLAARADNRKKTHVRAFLVALASQIGAANRKDEVAAVLSSLDGMKQNEQDLSRSIVRALVAKQPAATRSRLALGKGGRAASILRDLLRDSKTAALDEKRKLAQRVEAVRILALADLADVEDLFAELLDLRQPQPVQAAVLETLAGFDRPRVAVLVLDAWSGLSPKLRERATETLLSRRMWVSAFLDAVEQKTISRADVDPARIKLLGTHPDATIRKRVASVFAGSKLSARKNVVVAYQRALKIEGDVVRGKAHFKKSCSACHRLEGVGDAIGADLKGISNRGTEAVLLNILDPNREVKPKFLNYVLETEKGLVIAGMIVGESANSITLRRSDGTTKTVLRIDIAQMKSTGLSFMPEGLEKQIDQQAMADLLAYLRSIK